MPDEYWDLKLDYTIDNQSFYGQQERIEYRVRLMAKKNQ